MKAPNASERKSRTGKDFPADTGRIDPGALERIANGEIEHEIGDIRRFVKDPFRSVGQPGIPYRYRYVDPKYKDAEVETKACSNPHCHIVQKGMGKNGARPAGIGLQGPDISGVHE
jgi:hypothetical protein